jgi:hypothetical protein
VLGVGRDLARIAPSYACHRMDVGWRRATYIGEDTVRRFVPCIAAVALGVAACSGDAPTAADEPDPASAEAAEEAEPEPPAETRVEAAERREAEAAANPDREPEPEPEPWSYGSSRFYDNLFDLCESGDDNTACGPLYEDAPAGSEYHTLAEGRIRDELDEFMQSAERHDLLFDMTWTGMSPETQAEFCDAFETLGPEIAHQIFANAYGDEVPPIDRFEVYFDDAC